jgi:hypothetical protein
VDTGPQSDPIYAEPLEDPFEREKEPNPSSEPTRRTEPASEPAP